jgi:3-dehydroquinate synthase
MDQEYTFYFGGKQSCVRIGISLPSIGDIMEYFGQNPHETVLVCDTNTVHIARRIMEGQELPLCVLGAGEMFKQWTSIERILQTAKTAGLGRDGLFIGVGGGVISDMTAFAASVYMRGAKLCLAATSLLGMVDAAIGGKTGFDLFGLKNFAGTFYPAQLVCIAAETLNTLPRAEWKSGMAEVIKTAILDASADRFRFWELLFSNQESFAQGNETRLQMSREKKLMECITRSIEIKGRIVEADPEETGAERVLLNLGHTFAHGLEACAGLGRITHGEAVAWGISRACALGRALGITPRDRARSITDMLRGFGYETRSPHPRAQDAEILRQAIRQDKKKKAGTLRFIVPGEIGALTISEDFAPGLLEQIIKGEEGDL